MADGRDHTIATFFDTHAVPDAALRHFSSIPWTARLLRDGRYVALPTFSRVLKETGEDAFFAVTVNTPSTVAEALCLRRRTLDTPPPTNAGSPFNRTTAPANPYEAPVPAAPDAYLLLTLGSPGLDGHPNTLHGGFATAILDEVMGLCLMFHQMGASDPTAAIFTARLDTVYRRPVRTPGEVMVRTWLTGRQGRKWWARGQIVDKDGTVLAEAEGMWIEAGKRGQRL